jgi:hypothetical protein
VLLIDVKAENLISYIWGVTSIADQDVLTIFGKELSMADVVELFASDDFI